MGKGWSHSSQSGYNLIQAAFFTVCFELFVDVECLIACSEEVYGKLTADLGLSCLVRVLV